ncbi:FGGY-family carbohydrate kinase [Anaerotignum lactatifermentans]|uniref:FGGY-family carbohydrate kinase n=1 Tax=Anaerotignum lactatifermentans TaxID=160404 RepID=A0ABS2GBH4_9FIRM|nr:FGGY-family carbohydrate kinase [Anaerotignum lactatifermentans]MBM6830247.1 FGGY-family carbohydrate kinase [Anaerotignum lactatifermentans]MBM6878829.1 FGGY-family carbohydrate kinase [Anaerotignum lactatifermentans]MBM6951860.1 FGGY-family carbohydrate kinase [Anaerotignum lactatifermentans]
MAYYLGIDIGTRESKGVLLDEAGNLMETAVRSHDVENPQPGWFSQDADAVWWGDFCGLCHDLLEKSRIPAKKVACVGFSALGCDCVPVGADGRALSDAVLYGIDSRAEKEIQWALDTYGKDAVRLFGHTPCSSDVAPKIMWFRNHHREIWEKAYQFVTASSYLCGRLTGRYVLDPYLAEDFLPLYDLEKKRVHEELCRDFCRPDQLAELLPATEIAGTVTAEAAAQTGLVPGTKVLTGTGDSGAEAISAGLCLPGDVMIQLGSTGYLIYLADRMIQEPALWPGTFILPGTFGICGGTNTAGALTQWMKEQWYKDVTENAFAVMAKEAGQVPPGSEGLLCLPYFAGERTPLNDPKARGVFFGLETRHTRGHMVRAGLEGICYGIRANLELMKTHGLPIRRIFAVGGGTKNPVWMQCLADILEQEVAVPAVSLGAAYGDALMAAMADGAIGSWKELSQRIQMEKYYFPREEYGPIYRKQGGFFDTIYDRTKDIMHLLAEKDMEK